MSRIGRLPIPVTQGVAVTLQDGTVQVKGPKGGLTQALPRGITAAVEEGKIVVKRRDDTKSQRALHGLANLKRHHSR